MVCSICAVNNLYFYLTDVRVVLYLTGVVINMYNKHYYTDRYLDR